MALTVYNNLYSLTAQNNLATSNSSLSKSIERLSSGLRINSAADDASGLAVSEKLRGQIRGLAKASSNAQDAISFLQTAEGGMEEMTNIVQRMRELAVQSGNAGYTSNDRKELQKEFDQLKDEINRISASTEFNTKKLLTGDATALWSTDKDYLQAIVRGEVAEGNYQLNVALDPGQNQIQKTDIMSLNTKGIMAQIDTPSTAIAQLSGTSGFATGESITVAVAAAAITQDLSAQSVYNKSTASDLTTANVTVTMTGTANTSGYIEVEFLSGRTAAATAVTARYRIIDASTGEVGKWITATAGASVTIAGGSGLSSSAITIDLTTPDTIVTGDKILAKVQQGAALSVADGNGSVTVTNASGVTMSVVRTGGGTMVLQDNKDNKNDYLNVTASLATMDANGSVTVGITTARIAETTAAGTIAGTVNATITESSVADSLTKLKDIKLFTNADGRMLLDNTQELTIFGNGKQAVITMEGDDTIEDFQNKLTKALIEELGMGATVETAGSEAAAREINSNLVNFVLDGQQTAGGDQAVPGTFLIQTALLGTQSEVSFIGDEGILNALSLQEMQKAENSSTTVTVTDAHTGSLIGKDTVSDQTLRGVIKGIDVKIDSNVGLAQEWDELTNSIKFSASASDATAYLHVVKNASVAQIGANEGQTIDISIAQLDTASLEIDDAFVITQEQAAKAITKMDRALERINSTRATVGAQINRLEYTINNLATGKENLTAAESRIRDLDIAEETSTFSKNQILVNSAISMLAQANQLPQMALNLIG